MMYARFVNMQINADISQEDARIAHQISTMHDPPASDFDRDAEIAFQQQLEIMVTPP